MSEIDTTPSVGPQETAQIHSVQPASPKKRQFHEIDGSDGERGGGQVGNTTGVGSVQIVAEAAADTSAAQNLQLEPQSMTPPAQTHHTSQQQETPAHNEVPVTTQASVPPSNPPNITIPSSAPHPPIDQVSSTNVPPVPLSIPTTQHPMPRPPTDQYTYPPQYLPNQHFLPNPIQTPSTNSSGNAFSPPIPPTYVPSQQGAQMPEFMPNYGPNPAAYSVPPTNYPMQQAGPIPIPGPTGASPAASQAASAVTTGSTSAPPPSKKVKLSTEEKLAKERLKAEEKARKEEEKRQKEEEKRKRDEEREAKRKQKEEERQAKEEEKRKKEEEKKKKERSQMRLNAFFSKPAASKQLGARNGSNSTAGSGSKSEQREKTEYQREFPSFFLQSHTKVAPPNRFERDSDALAHIQGKIDKCLRGEGGSGTNEKFNAAQLFNVMPYRRRQGRVNSPTVKEILTSMNDSSMNHIDLTREDATKGPTTRLEDLLKKIPMKTLKFREDVRPPYQGTFTKRISDELAVKLCRDPFARAIEELNYDYDSEAEWEEPEEGEDIDSEGEDDTSEDGDDDMEDFLDDSGEQVKRGAITSDLEPVCSGIKWDDGNGIDPSFEPYRMAIIYETLNFPIDPFSDSYWKKPVTAPPSSPFKVPLHPSDAAKQQQMLQSHSPSPLAQSATVSQPGNLTTLLNCAPGAVLGPRARNPFPPVLLPEFKEIVSGSDLTKAGLIEVLKKRFPKVSKETIKDTLTATAVRRGQKEVDKRWVLI